jgi:uncharacterized protein (TIGR02145 family)
MKKILLLIMMYIPAVLIAQNGVTVSNLVVSAGTATFNVSWDKNAIPVELWSDTVWVFVDYNRNGVMTRLPLESGATLIAHTAPGTGNVMEVPDNNKGVWVVGNARSAGSFSATVQLLTKASNIRGACVYASNYPPVGRSTSAMEISFTGTPMYEISLARPDGGNVTVKSGGTFLMPQGYALTSFVDATGAPGVLLSSVFTLQASAAGYCDGEPGIGFSLSSTQVGITYQLIRNGTDVVATLLGTGIASAFSGTHTPGSYSARSISTAMYSGVMMSGRHTVTKYALPVISAVAPAVICHNTAADLNAEVSAGTTTAMTYTWNIGGAISITGAPDVISQNLTANTTYTVAVSNAYGCTATSNVATIPVYAAFTAGAIPTTSTIALEGLNPNFTIQSASPAAGGGTVTYLWRRSGTSDKELVNNTSTYIIGSDASNYTTAGVYHFNRYARNDGCNTAWVAAAGTHTLNVLSGTDQPQGGCTFTQPPWAGTFADFPSTYSASTFVTLLDERDGNNYTVMKIGDRWIMAQNLNYQKDLTWQPEAGNPSRSTGFNTLLIGHFWCPGVHNARTSTLESCDVWGALYSWETAMMVDGKWNSDTRAVSTWGTDPVYSTNTASGNENNGGRGAYGHGICPPNWYIPSDYEWGELLNAIESGTKEHNTGVNSRGSGAGKNGKADCTCGSSGVCATDQEAKWNRDTHSGSDAYGFRVLPSGNRNDNGADYNNRGTYGWFWSSSARTEGHAWYRRFHYDYTYVYRQHYNRSYGLSVRCMRRQN